MTTSTSQFLFLWKHLVSSLTHILTACKLLFSNEKIHYGLNIYKKNMSKIGLRFMLFGRRLIDKSFLKVDFSGKRESRYRVTNHAERGTKKGNKHGILILNWRRGRGRTHISLLHNLALSLKSPLLCLFLSNPSGMLGLHCCPGFL